MLNISNREVLMEEQHKFNMQSRKRNAILFTSEGGSVPEMGMDIPVDRIEARLFLSQELEELANGPVYIEFLEDEDCVRISGHVVNMGELIILLKDKVNLSHWRIPEA